jgi:S-adenosyl methyltransferase
MAMASGHPGVVNGARSGEPEAFDPGVAHVARVYNYWLGGTANYPADREAAEQAIAAYPDMVRSVRANRAFLARTARWLTRDGGIRQFLDIGTGIPAAGNTHEVAQSVAPESRVVYADHDPIVLEHARSLLTSTPEGATDYLDADLRAPGQIITEAGRTLDFRQPVAIVLMAVLQFIPDEDAGRIVAELLDAVPAGSYLVISHPASDIDVESMATVASRLNRLMSQRVVLRRHGDVARFFDGLDLVAPGVVRIPEWRPDSPGDVDTPATMWGGVGQKS